METPQPRKIVRRLFWGIGIGVCLLVIAFVLRIDSAIDDAYAQWGAVDHVIEYMETHDGQWPKGWEDLRPLYETKGGRCGGWTFEDYKSRLVIDFDADADQLRKLAVKSEAVPFDVIGARWSFAATMGDGPNSMLYWYFREKAGLPLPTVEPTLPPPMPSPASAKPSPG